MSAPRIVLDVARCDVLAVAAIDGDRTAWSQLVEALWPSLLEIVRGNRSMGPLARSDDDVREVCSLVLGKMGGRDGRGLRLYVAWRARHPEKDFADWLRITAKNNIRDHVRARLAESTSTKSEQEPGAKRLLNEFAASPILEKLGMRPPVTAAQTARQLLEFARAHVSGEGYLALTLWVQGCSFEEIQSECELASTQDAHHLVRAAVAVLRREFAPTA